MRKADSKTRGRQELEFLMKQLTAKEEQRDINLAFEFSFKFGDFLKKNNLEKKHLRLYNAILNNKKIDIAKIKNQNPDLFKKFVDYLKNDEKIEPSPLLSDYFRSPRFIEKRWLIHFTDSFPTDIAKNGFKGVLNFESLPFTPRKVSEEEGFNFAFDLSDYVRDGALYDIHGRRKWKYGEHAVLFRAEGIKVYHVGDNEMQVIFWGPSAEDIIPISYDKANEIYGVFSEKNHDYLYHSRDLADVVKWAVENRNKLVKHFKQIKKRYAEKKKHAKKIIKEILLKEYFNRMVGDAWKYLKKSRKEKIEELAENYYYLFSIFYHDRFGEADLRNICAFELTEKQPYPKTYFTKKDVQQRNKLNQERKKIFGEDAPEINTKEFVDWLKKNRRPLFDEFGKYLLRKFSENCLPQLDSTQYPSWIYLKLRPPEIVKNQWLVHFCSDPLSIAINGFSRGVSNYKTLGLTGWIPLDEKKSHGYNFAFLASDIEKQKKTSRLEFGGEIYKYGAHAVVFKASGIKVWHVGDREYQVIFDGKTAKNIVPIEKDFPTGLWKIYGKNKKILFKSKRLKKIVDWVILNYDQYRKQFNY